MLLNKKVTYFGVLTVILVIVLTSPITSSMSQWSLESLCIAGRNWGWRTGIPPGPGREHSIHIKFKPKQSWWIVPEVRMEVNSGEKERWWQRGGICGDSVVLELFWEVITRVCSMYKNSLDCPRTICELLHVSVCSGVNSGPQKDASKS